MKNKEQIAHKHTDRGMHPLGFCFTGLFHGVTSG